MHNISKPLVSIVIVSKNYGQYLYKSLNSVINQTYKNIEIYVVDDFSKDNSKVIIKKLKKKFPYINYIINKKNIGLQKISNSIINKCRGKFYLRLDADDWLDLNSIKRMVNTFNSKKNVDAIYGNYYYTNNSEKIIGYEKNLNIIKKYIAPHGACTMYKVNDLKKVKGYFTDIKAQDGWDAWFKLKNKINYYHLKFPIFYYRQHVSSLTKRKKNILRERGKIFNKMAKNHENFKKRVSAIIPIKNSFDDLKNVPFKKIGKSSLIDKQLKTLKKLEIISDVIFTTSSQRVINYLNKKKNFLKNKNIYIFKRPNKFEKSISSLQEILEFSKREYFKKGGKCEIFIFMNLHILRKKFDHLESAINLLKISDFEIVFSVYKEKEPIFKFEKEKFSLLNAGRFNNLDFNSETIFKFNGSVICGNWSILNKGNMFKKKSGFVETSVDEIININNLDKFK